MERVESWLYLRLERSRDAMLDELLANVHGAAPAGAARSSPRRTTLPSPGLASPAASSELALVDPLLSPSSPSSSVAAAPRPAEQSVSYGHVALETCRRQWRELLQELHEKAAVAQDAQVYRATNQHAELVELRNMNAVLRRQLRSHDAIARRLHKTLLGAPPGSGQVTIDPIMATLDDATQKLLVDMFAVQQADERRNGHPFSPDDFNLAEYWRLAEFKLREALSRGASSGEGGASSGSKALQREKELEQDLAMGQLRRDHEIAFAKLERQVEAERRTSAALRDEVAEAAAASEKEAARIRDRHALEVEALKHASQQELEMMTNELSSKLAQLQSYNDHHGALAAKERADAAESLKAALANGKARMEKAQANSVVRVNGEVARQTHADELDEAASLLRKQSTLASSAASSPKSAGGLARKQSAARGSLRGGRTSPRSEVTAYGGEASEWEGQDHDTLVKLLLKTKHEVRVLTASHEVQMKARVLEWESTIRDAISRYEGDLRSTAAFLEVEKNRSKELHSEGMELRHQLSSVKFDLAAEKKVGTERIAEVERQAKEEIRVAHYDAAKAQAAFDGLKEGHDKAVAAAKELEGRVDKLQDEAEKVPLLQFELAKLRGELGGLPKGCQTELSGPVVVDDGTFSSNSDDSLTDDGEGGKVVKKTRRRRRVGRRRARGHHSVTPTPHSLTPTAMRDGDASFDTSASPKDKAGGHTRSRSTKDSRPDVRGESRDSGAKDAPKGGSPRVAGARRTSATRHRRSSVSSHVSEGTSSADDGDALAEAAPQVRFDGDSAAKVAGLRQSFFLAGTGSHADVTDDGGAAAAPSGQRSAPSVSPSSRPAAPPAAAPAAAAAPLEVSPDDAATNKAPAKPTGKSASARRNRVASVTVRPPPRVASAPGGDKPQPAFGEQSLDGSGGLPAIDERQAKADAVFAGGKRQAGGRGRTLSV